MIVLCPECSAPPIRPTEHRIRHILAPTDTDARHLAALVPYLRNTCDVCATPLPLAHGHPTFLRSVTA